MKLIDGWKKAYRLFSVQAMVVAAAIQGAWPTIPEDMKAQLPPHLVHYISLVLLIGGILGRLVSQPKDTP